MYKIVTFVLCALLFSSLLMAQEADSLLLADFEDDQGTWGGWGDAFETADLALDPEDENNSVLECIIDCAREGEKKAGVSSSNLNIFVDDDTASALVIYIWIEEGMFAELQGAQIFCMDQTAWQWGATWYTTSAMNEGAWNRFQYDFSNSFQNIAGFGDNAPGGVTCGVEFVFNTEAFWYGSIYCDNIYFMGLKGGASSVESESPANAVTNFELEQNYPNPFNPTTNIVYTLPVRDRVSVSIYDVTGRLVSTLVDGEVQPAGRISIPFNAAGMSSGVYYYRVQTSQSTQMKKMVLVQ